MSPRNQDITDCKSDLYPGESDDSLNVDFTPNILHKKHKVIKLVKAQLQNLQDCRALPEEKDYEDKQSLKSAEDNDLNPEGNDLSPVTQKRDVTLDISDHARLSRASDNGSSFDNQDLSEPMSPLMWWLLCLLLFLTGLFILLLLAACLAAGPLSNRAPHTPIPWSSLVKTDSVCDLEKKYLLRWSAPNYLE